MMSFGDRGSSNPMASLMGSSLGKVASSAFGAEVLAPDNGTKAGPKAAPSLASAPAAIQPKAPVPVSVDTPGRHKSLLGV